jgi:hypothetical protein
MHVYAGGNVTDVDVGGDGAFVINTAIAIKNSNHLSIAEYVMVTVFATWECTDSGPCHLMTPTTPPVWRSQLTTNGFL